MAQHKTMTIQFIDGEAQGLRLCNCAGSLFTTVYMPRPYLARAKQLQLPMRGIYFLLKVDGSEIKRVYAGQTTQGMKRLIDHNSKKKWWDRAVLFLSDDINNFTLDTVNGLEKFAIEKIMTTMGGIVENKVAPKYKITPFQMPFIQSLYDEIEFMMAALGLELKLAQPASGSSGQKPPAPASGGSASTGGAAQPAPSMGCAVSMKRHGITVVGTYSGGSKGTLTVLKGATIELGANVHPKDKATSTLRSQLLAQGKLMPQNNGLAVLLEDVSFDSPTAAAQFVFGGSINGRVNWKDASGKSIKDLFG